MSANPASAEYAACVEYFSGADAIMRVDIASKIAT